MAQVVAVVAGLGCGGGNSTSASGGSSEGGVSVRSDAAEDGLASSDVAESAPYPAPHAAPPRAVTFGGPVLHAPRLVPVFFENDLLEGEVESFLTQLAASSYWPGVTREYGVGPLTVAPSIVVTDTPPASTTDAEVRAWLAGYLDGTHPVWPPVSLDNIYMVFYPTSTTITLPNAGVSCMGFGGYHDEGFVGPVALLDGGGGEGGSAEGGAVDGGTGGGTRDAGAPDAEGTDGGATPYVYAVIPRCVSFGGNTGIDAVTHAVSHETVEASSDPLFRSHRAYGGVDGDHLVWEFKPGGEVADLCAYEPQSDQRLVGTFLVQRVWSNVAAALGQDPCVPPIPITPSPVYYNAAPDLTAPTTLTYAGVKYATRGVRAPVGKTATFDLRFFSTDPTDTWTAYMEDTSFAFGGPILLEFEPNSIRGRNGDVVSVTVTAVAAGPYGGTEFSVVSYRPPNVATLEYWFGFVEN